MKHIATTDSLVSGILREIEKLPVIDAHEHLWSEKERLSFEGMDIFRLLTPFVVDDLVSAGAPPSLRGLWSVGPMDGLPRRPSMTQDEIWQAIAPYWKAVGQTSHTQSFKHSLKILFGVDNITADNFRGLSQKIAEHATSGLYKKILEDTCGIRCQIAVKSINWHGIIPPEGIGRWIMHMWPFACWNSAADARQLEKDTKTTIRSFKDADDVLFATMEKAKRAGYVGIKTARGIDQPIGKVDPSNAAGTFEKMLRLPSHEALSAAERQQLNDHCLYRLFEAARLNDLTVAVHTTGFPDNNSCTNLVDAFKSFPDVRFDLYHGSMPQTREIGRLAKTFPNVFLNMCWMPAVSRTMAVNALQEWLDMVPLNKIIGFGGDCFYVEAVPGALALAREVIAETLAARIRAGLITETEAIEIARRLLFDNPNEIYRLKL